MNKQNIIKAVVVIAVIVGLLWGVKLLKGGAAPSMASAAPGNGA